MKINSESRHFNIPVFIPELACPHQCVFCNQRKISGTLVSPTIDEVDAKIRAYLATIPSEGSKVEIAFFGGNFTGIPIQEMTNFLKTASTYLQSGQVDSIRVSTRPDYINDEILSVLQRFGVHTIELGAQSLDDEVLQLSERGHTLADIEKASRSILSWGFSLGLQMMTGLPGDDAEKSIATAKKIVELGADNTRIYPTLVIKDTALADIYLKGKYQPLTITEAVDRVKPLIRIFEAANVTILRIGLHPSEGLLTGNDLLAGPFHVSFKELVLTDIWKDMLTPYGISSEKKEINIFVPPTELNVAVGYQALNRKMLLQHFRKVKFLPDASLTDRNFYVDYR